MVNDKVEAQSSRANTSVTVGGKPINSIDDVTFEVGSGSKTAIFAVQWITAPVSEWSDPADEDIHFLAWKYKFDGKATGQDMILAIAKEDPRFFVVLGRGFGSVSGNANSIQGFGYDVDGNGEFTIAKGDTVYSQNSFIDGVLRLRGDDTADYYTVSGDDFWMGGWKAMYCTYWCAENMTSIPTTFSYSMYMADLRYLQDNSWDAWTCSTINSSYINVQPYPECMVAAE